MAEFLQNWLIEQGVNAQISEMLSMGATFLFILVLAFIADKIARRFILKGVSFLISKTKSKWDDALAENNFFNQIAHLAPAIVIYILFPSALVGNLQIISFVQSVVIVYMIILGIIILDSFLNATHDIYNTYPALREIPIKGFIQVTKLVFYFIGGIFIISIAINKTPVYLFSGLGAMTAVLMFIFKDAILGFVAGIQLTANRMVSHGDWISMPKYGADGDVLEVGLTTVKVQNWDKTITTIPTYALISESFQNWRGMRESGGRRIKRAVYIDVNTITFCTEEMLERFRKIQYIADYMERKRAELEEFNRNIEGASQINLRRLTNIGTFRAYVDAYLKNHPMINQEMTFLIRQLQPTENGLPIEIYVFCKDIAWANYEVVQADIFDHILAAIHEFDLKVFQNPTGSDFRELKKA
ncbi:MAG: mechanosensitive ion channel [Thermodesulfobacteriota bacterium]|nr:mechanosensitive ion channel [Thermodesulfobacteriota bacterium]